MYMYMYMFMYMFRSCRGHVHHGKQHVRDIKVTPMVMKGSLQGLQLFNENLMVTGC